MNNEIYNYEYQRLQKVIEIINEKLEEAKNNFKKQEHNIIGFKEGQRGTQFTRQSMMSLYATEVYDLKFILSNPYFARFDFKGLNEKEINEIYIGKKLITGKNGEIIAYDWRSPICSMYYDYNIGKSEYKLNNETKKGEILSKRQIIIKDGVLKDVLEQDTLSNDSILMKYLNEHADSRLKTIIATIQKEQNKIIRSPMNKDYIIQGVAGSGKTTVALHRIAYLLYNEARNTNEADFMIIGPNKYFLNYISELLPELEVKNIYQTTFDEIALNNLNCKVKVESRNITLQNVLSNQTDKEIISYKNSMQYMNLIERFINDYMKSHLTEAITYEGIELCSKERLSVIYDSIFNTRSYSERINNFTKMLTKQIKEHYDDLIHQVWLNYREEVLSLPKNSPERKELTKMVDEIQETIKKGCSTQIKNYFKFTKVNSLYLYQAFIENIDLYKNEISVDIDKLKEYTLSKLTKKQITSDDLAPMLLINQMLNGIKQDGKYNHLVIDEAQDLSIPQYYMLKRIFPQAKIDVFGDINQSIYDYQAFDNWEQLNSVIFDNKAELLELNKSYRTTTQIADTSKLVLEKLKNNNSVNCITRSGKDVFVSSNEENNVITIINQIKQIIDNGYETIAIICKDDKETENLFKKLKKYNLDITKISENNEKYTGGLCILPSYLSKGLEFDAVIISNANDILYTEDNIDLKLLYVSVTRAMHELYINYNGNITKSLESLVKEKNKILTKKVK